MATKKTIINAVSLDVPADKKAEMGKPLVIQLAPFGEYPNTADGEDENGKPVKRDVVQKVDEQAVDTLVSNFKDKVLVDADHSSALSTDTKAMAWVVKLFKDPEKGLMAEIEPTSEGVEKINGKVYRFVSAEWTLDDDDRPVELVAVGLTNRPNLPVSPMLNSQAAKNTPPGTDTANVGVTDKGSGSTANAGEGNGGGKENTPANTQGDNQEPTTKKETHTMDFRELLGLTSEATDEEVKAAIEALKATAKAFESVKGVLQSPDASNEEVVNGVTELVETAKNAVEQVEAAEAEKLNCEANEFVAQNEDVIPEEAVESVKEEYKADPEAAKKTVANFRLVAEKRERVLNAKHEEALKAAKATQHFKASNAAAKKPTVVNMKDALAKCNGDPDAEIKALEEMANQ